MCLLILKPANQTLPFEHLEEGYYSNPDGTGIVFATGKKLITVKGSEYSHEEIASFVSENSHLPMIVHFRLASHGAINDDNTHPFSLPHGWSAAHNGIINLPILDAAKSDTREFLDRYVAPLLLSNKRALLNRGTLDALSVSVGTYNKLAFLHKSGEWSLVNEGSGHWANGVWYSNSSYEPSIYTPVKDDFLTANGTDDYSRLF